MGHIAEGGTIFLCSHILEVAERMCTRVAVIDQGRLGGHALATLIGFSVFAGLAYAYRALRGREGLGLGDAKLFAAAGAWVGWEALPSVLLIGTVACLVGAFIGRAFGGTLSWSQRLAFGPYLALGFWVVWLHGPLALGR